MVSGVLFDDREEKLYLLFTEVFNLPIFGYNHKKYITRADGVSDTGRVDMGYHYPFHIQFGLSIDVGANGGSPSKTPVSSGDELSLFFDITTAPEEITADIFLILLDPDGNLRSGLTWNKGVAPLVSGYKLNANLNIEGAQIASFTIPGSKPPVDAPGTYTFYLAAVKPGGVDFISNIEIASFKVK